MSATIYFFAFWLTFDISLVLKFIQCLYAFYKEKWNSDEARWSIFEGFQLCSYFFMKNAYLVTAKITRDVNDFLYVA